MQAGMIAVLLILAALAPALRARTAPRPSWDSLSAVQQARLLAEGRRRIRELWRQP